MPVQLGRQILAQLAVVPGRADWKGCTAGEAAGEFQVNYLSGGAELSLQFCAKECCRKHKVGKATWQLLPHADAQTLVTGLWGAPCCAFDVTRVCKSPKDQYVHACTAAHDQAMLYQESNRSRCSEWAAVQAISLCCLLLLLTCCLLLVLCAAPEAEAEAAEAFRQYFKQYDPAQAAAEEEPAAAAAGEAPAAADDVAAAAATEEPAQAAAQE